MICCSVQAHAIAAAVQAREVSAQDMAQAALRRVQATDIRVNAFTEVTSRARWPRPRAGPTHRKRRAGHAGAALAGRALRGQEPLRHRRITTLAGSKIERGRPAAAHDAVLVQRLHGRRCGAGRCLNMDEYAYGFTTENTHYGPTHNPHDLTRIAGGSSGGSAAAVAAGQVPVSLGSDTNGSIRVPASLCGVFGLKPTFGRLPRTGSYPFVANLDHLGPFARNVRDLALSYDADAGLRRRLRGL
jgi:amidase/aspartyl-tRNA(Asn)/glutamyl-tRNA(Gln) amidotransferase subunit A